MRLIFFAPLLLGVGGEGRRGRGAAGAPARRGAARGRVVELLNDWAARARQKTPEGQEPPWSARNFVPYWSQILSTTVQSAAPRRGDPQPRARGDGEAQRGVHARTRAKPAGGAPNQTSISVCP